jgi:hypothetical protein
MVPALKEPVQKWRIPSSPLEKKKRKKKKKKPKKVEDQKVLKNAQVKFLLETFNLEKRKQRRKR